MPGASTFFPLGRAKRDVTGQELRGGISPGTVCLVAALELLLISLRFSHT
jgi:hypothetical protein